MRFLWAAFPLWVAVGCISRIVEPIPMHPPKARTRTVPPKPAEDEASTVRVRVPTIDECCAPLLALELCKLPGVLRVENPEPTLFVVERDPKTASNKIILDYVSKEWAPARVEPAESREGP